MNSMAMHLPTCALALLLTTAAPAQSHWAPAETAYKIPAERVAGLQDFVDGVMAQQIATREVAGAIVTVVHKDGVLFSRGYGYADIDKGIEVDPQQTLFRPGSVSKMFTWTALMQQVELGRINLDADVNMYLDFTIPPFGGQPIRVRDLLSHSPGMSDVGGITAPSLDKVVPFAEWVKLNIPKRLWPANSEVSYSNYGTVLAGYIVERVSGERFADYVERHIFVPLGMISTSFREPLPEHLAANMASGYRMENGRLVAETFEWFSPVMPAGSASTTGPDMALFMNMMLNSGVGNEVEILKAESVALLMRNSIANAPGLSGMAHGFFVVREKGPRLLGHGGNTGDFHSNMILAPELKLGFFISHSGGDGSYGGRTELTEALIGRLFPVERAARVAASAGEVVPTGSYRVNRRDYNRPINARYDINISAAGANAISVLNDGRTSYWERIGPGMFEQVTGTRKGGPFEQLKFYERGGGWRLSFSSLPHVTYHHVNDAPTPEKTE